MKKKLVLLPLLCTLMSMTACDMLMPARRNRSSSLDEQSSYFDDSSDDFISASSGSRSEKSSSNEERSSKQSSSSEKSSSSKQSSSSEQHSSPEEQSSSQKPSSSEQEHYSGFNFRLLDNGTYAVGASDRGISGNVSIPSSYNGKAVTEIYEWGFEYCENMTSISIPNSVTKIGDYAFPCCNSLTTLNIPNRVTYIGIGSIQSCSSLTTVVLGNSVNYIGEIAFANCSKLENITIPNSLKTLGENAFENCTSLVYTNYQNGSYLGNTNNPYLVLVKGENKDITTCEINNNCRFIASQAFNGYSSLMSVTLPESLESLGSWVFLSCRSLTSIGTIGANVSYIGKVPIYDCGNISALVVNENNQYYLSDNDCLYTKDYKSLIAHAGGSSNRRVTLSSNTEVIEKAAFLNNGSLTITLNDGLKEIREEGLGGCSLNFKNEDGLLYIPSATNNYFALLYGTNASSKNVSVNEQCKIVADNAFFCSSVQTAVIPGSVITIGGRAFNGCNDLTSITLNEGLNKIGEMAFCQCFGLTEIIIPNTVTEIEQSAFLDCNNLTNVRLSNRLTNISHALFESCSKIKTLTIPGGVKEIGMHAFANSGITTLVVPTSVTTIKEYAFYNCNALRLFFLGNENVWSNVTIESMGNWDLNSNNIYFYSQSLPSQSGRYWHYVDDVPTPWN